MPKFYYYLGDEQFQPEVLVEHAKLAEKSGFDGLFISEHFHPWVDDDGAAGFAFSTLGAIAEVTKDMALMTGVTTPLFRFHPALMAQIAATIDRLSHGKFNLGVGTGENINEGPLGYQFPGYKERAERMGEALEIMRRLLNGEKVTFNGKHYKTDRAKLYSPPIGDVPIFLAAGGEKSAQLAAKKAQGIITSVKDPQKALGEVLTPARQLAPNIQVVATRWCVVAKNNKEALQALHPWRGLRVPDRLEAVDPEELRKTADTMDPSEILGAYSIAQNADQIIEIYKPLIEILQADVIVLQTTSIDQEKTIEMLGKEVLPKLRI